MNILLLTQIIPYPPDSGPRVKTYHVLRYLAEHGHRVTLASFVRQEEEKYLPDLKPYCAEICPVSLRRSRLADVQALASSFRSGLPFLVTRDAKEEMTELVRQLMRREPFDIVHADQLTMAQYAIQAAEANREKRPAIVFDAHNAVWTIVERSREGAPFFFQSLLAGEARRIKRYEGESIHKFDRILAVSEVDREKLLEASALVDGGQEPPVGRQAAGNRNARIETRDPRSKITVIPIAVDCARLEVVQPVSQSPHILTIGTLYYPPNADGIRWFLREVYPMVKTVVPDTVLTIVGPRPPRDIVEFGRRDPDGVKVTGYVPDLLPYFQNAALMVVPVRAASGMRVRILEALARGMPVVTTTTGVEGIEAVSGEHLLIADTPAQFAEAVEKLLRDRPLRERLAQNGRRLVETKYDWQVVLPQLEQVYGALTGTLVPS